MHFITLLLKNQARTIDLRAPRPAVAAEKLGEAGRTASGRGGVREFSEGGPVFGTVALVGRQGKGVRGAKLWTPGFP